MKRIIFITLLIMLLLTSSLAFAADKVEVQFWHAMGGWRIELLQEMANDFMALHPDINVDVQYTGSYGDTINKLNVAIQSNVAPHIVQGYDIATQMLIDGEIAVPMQDLIDADPEFDIGTFMPQVLNYYRVNGKLYCMPFNSSNAVMFYNRTLFEKAGLDPNKPPKTYKELYEYSKMLTKKMIKEMSNRQVFVGIFIVGSLKNSWLNRMLHLLIIIMGELVDRPKRYLIRMPD